MILASRDNLRIYSAWHLRSRWSFRVIFFSFKTHRSQRGSHLEFTCYRAVKKVTPEINCPTYYESWPIYSKLRWIFPVTILSSHLLASHEPECLTVLIVWIRHWRIDSVIFFSSHWSPSYSDWILQFTCEKDNWTIVFWKTKRISCRSWTFLPTFLFFGLIRQPEASDRKNVNLLLIVRTSDRRKKRWPNYEKEITAVSSAIQWLKITKEKNLFLALNDSINLSLARAPVLSRIDLPWSHACVAKAVTMTTIDHRLSKLLLLLAVPW